MARAGHLHAVTLTDENGEVQETTKPALEVAVSRLRDEVRGLERNNKGWIRRCAELERDHEAEAEAHELWPLAMRLFQHWQDECNHKKAEWTWERFEMVLPFLKRRKYGSEFCLRAIAGAAYDPWTKVRRNGSKYRHDGWDVIFGKGPGVFEDFANKAPLPWVAPDMLDTLLELAPGR